MITEFNYPPSGLDPRFDDLRDAGIGVHEARRMLLLETLRRKVQIIAADHTDEHMHTLACVVEDLIGLTEGRQP
jgi:hypothetical protein